MTTGLTVIQSVSRWLPQTATWLDTQVKNLPADIHNHIVCEATLNLDQFPHPHIHSLGDQPRWQGIVDRGIRKLGVRRHLGFLVATARAQRAALLHSHFGDMGWYNVGGARAASMRHVVTFYGLDVVYYPRSDPRWKKRYGQLFATVDHVLCEGPHMGREIAALGCPEGKIIVHHLGIDVNAIPFEPRRWQPGETLRVLLAGSFREKKGFPDAVDALGMLQRDVPLEITIIGDEHGEERTKREKQKILAAIARHDLASKTRLLGYIPYRDMLEEARRHHVFLSPSVTASDGDTEGGAPVSLIEMSASGMVVVSTTHCDIPGVILDGATGYLAPERDVEALVARLRAAVASHPRWPEMQRAGRSHIESEFNARIQGERLAAIYRDICRQA